MNRETIETEINELLRDLHGESRSVSQLRTRIAGVLLRAAPELASRATYWAKAHLVLACRAFNDNARASIGAHDDPTWLAYCLLQLRDAFLPRGAYIEDYAPRDHVIDRLTFDELGHLVRREFELFAA